jgi:protocatechuate 3,4-dioxygenase beta subunit
VVTSVTRPRSIRLRNSVTETVHPTGMAVDLRKPTRGSCLRWLRRTLLDVEGEGVIEATEERRPPHFHVAVFPRQYSAYVQGRTGTRLASSGGAKSARRPSVRGTYRVRQGDSLWTIARRHGVSVARIKEANGLRSSRLAIGQKIVIPGGS